MMLRERGQPLKSDSSSGSGADEGMLDHQAGAVNVANSAQSRPMLHLASRSARRRELLDAAGISHDAEHPGFEDGVLTPGRATPEQWVASLAYLKAWSRGREKLAHEKSSACGAQGWTGPRFVLGADTACVADGRMIGTPTTAYEARAMLCDFRNREHDVVTGVALIDRQTGRRHLFVDRATVRVGMLTDPQIDQYVATNAWHGKAGGYNLRERMDAGWPIEFTGDPSTIMGLPMGVLLRALRALGLRPSAAFSA